MKAHFNGRWVEICEDWRAREQVEAENALNIDFMDASSFQQMLVLLYMSVRQVDREIPIAVLADQVMNVEFSSFAEMEEKEEGAAEVPLDIETPDTLGNGNPPTGGHPLSVPSGSP